MKRKIAVLLLIILMITSAACSTNAGYQNTDEAEVSTLVESAQENDAAVQMASNTTVNLANDDLDLTGSIYLEGNSIRAEGTGIEIEGTIVTILAVGSYNISGTLKYGQGEFTNSGNYSLVINGGYIVINANGDGIDSNGSIEINGSEVIVYGPTANNNSPTDYMGTFNINGGFIVAVGSSGMAQPASLTSTQYSVLYNFINTQANGTILQLESQDGEEVVTLVPLKEYQSILISSPKLTSGTSYNLYTGGRYSGVETNGLYSDGTYTGGSLIASFTISSIVTNEGAASTRMDGSGGGRGGRPGGDNGMQPPGQ